MLIVIDTSAVIACLLNEPERAAILTITTGQVLIAPTSLPIEIGNALASMFKKRTLEVDEAVGAFRLYQQLPISTRPVDVEAAIRLCGRLRIYAYDAYMLQCAIESGGHLLTVDGGLRTAARAVSVPVFEVKP